MENIIKKFKFRDNGIVLNAPLTIENEFVKIGFKTNLSKKIKNTNTIVFINNSKEYIDFLKNGFEKY